MQTAANSSLVLTDFSSFKRFADLQEAISYGGFYQLITSGLIKGISKRQAFLELGDRLVMLAELTHEFRRMDLLEQLSRVLVSLPLSARYGVVGRFYQALCIHNFGRGDVEKAAGLLGNVAHSGPVPYRIRALRSLGANSIRRGEYRSALSFYSEADRFALEAGFLDPVSIVRTQKDIAVINSLEGNHRQAAQLLENLYPLARAVRLSQPHVYYHYMNSLAVELCEVGRLEEARNISRIVLASPYAPAYPEWRETRDEIELKGWRPSRSVVAFSQTIANEASSRTAPEGRNLIQLPLRENDDSDAEPSATGTLAIVLHMQEWKKKMTNQQEKRPRPTTDQEKQARIEELLNLTPREVLVRIMDNLGDESVSDDLLRKALMLLEGIEPDASHGH